MSAYAQHRLVNNVKRRHLTLLVSVQAYHSSATNEKEIPTHMYFIHVEKVCLRVAYPSAHSTGIFTIHPFGIHSILAAVAFDCGSLDRTASVK